MTLDEILDYVAARPVSCGARADNNAYLQWKVHLSQLWRHDEFQLKMQDVEPITFTPIQIRRVVDHVTPPRKGDRVIKDQSVGVILYHNRSDNEVTIFWFDTKRTKTVWMDDLSPNKGSIRWRIHE